MTGDLRLIEMTEKTHEEQNILEKKPNKCPVCDGEGGIHWAASYHTSPDETCQACKGSGIVWG